LPPSLVYSLFLIVRNSGCDMDLRVLLVQSGATLICTITEKAIARIYFFGNVCRYGACSRSVKRDIWCSEPRVFLL
jgi:hypothetical protein